MYAISRVSHLRPLSLEKFYWHPGGKNAGGHWMRVCNGKRNSSPIPIRSYYEEKHAKGVMTRYGWKNNSLYTYVIEKVI